MLAVKDANTAAFEEREGYDVRRIKVRTRRLARFGIFKPLTASETAARMLWRGWRAKADVYDVRNLEPLAVGWLLARVRRAKLIYSSDELCLDRDIFAEKPEWIRRLYAAYERYFINRADVVIIPDRYRGKALEERYPDVRPIIVRNVSEVVKPLPKRAPLPELDRHRLKVLLYQGLLAEGRGLEECVRSLEQLEDSAFLVVGAGPLRRELQLLAEDLRVADRVIFRQALPQEELLRYTAAADAGMVLVQDTSMSQYLCAPNKFYEYLMMGVPVVASDFPEMRDIVMTYNVGTLVDDPSDPRGIGRAIRRMFADKEEYQQMRRNARKLALSRFNWDVEKKGLLVAYDRVLGERTT